MRSTTHPFNFVLLLLSVVVIPHWIAGDLSAQPRLSVIREIQLQGSFRLLIGDEMTITDVEGKERKLRIQEDAQKPISLTGGDIALDQHAEIAVKATVTADVLQPGMVVSLKCQLGASGRTGAITSAVLMPVGSPALGVFVDDLPEGADLVDATVQGVIKSIDSKRMIVNVPRHELAPGQKLTFDATGIGEIEYTTTSLRMLQKGDVITQVDAADLSTGDCVVRRMQAELVGVRDDLKLTVNELLQLRHHDKSDEPGEPRWFRSQHYRVKTDISDRQASVLLDKLEQMYELVGGYYGRHPGGQLEVYVVRDIDNWDVSEWEPRVATKLRRGEGTTIYARQGGQQHAVVFSADNQDVVQHEAVHGFCFLTFQGTGPLWYAEGIAEMGQYWRADDVSVTANPAVIGYLRSREPQPLMSIINATQIEGEFWKAYAWRWALCHFLATNPNYAKDFRQLGIALMRKRRGASFENTWRRKASELTFEYHQFLKHLEAGLRADLIAWQWGGKWTRPNAGRGLQRKIQAARGWQATGAIVESGVSYETRTKGEWKISADSAMLDADGDDQGQGRLIGVIMNDRFELSGQFEIGADSDFVASGDGHLYVRCQERMSLIGDNDGEVNFAIRKRK